MRGPHFTEQPTVLKVVTIIEPIMMVVACDIGIATILHYSTPNCRGHVKTSGRIHIDQCPINRFQAD